MNESQLTAIAVKLGLGQFDLLLVADGSGTLATKPCGWCCIAYAPAVHEVVEHVGGTSGGTNNYAELSPFIHALWFHQNRNSVSKFKIELVSDSQMTVRCGNRNYSRNSNQALWACIDWFEQQGHTLHWNWVPRNSNEVNLQADKRGRSVRLLLETFLKV